MKNKSLVQQALDSVPSFRQSYTKFCNTLLVEQKSEETIKNYTRYFADICLTYHCLAEELTKDQIEMYLADKLRLGCSQSLFKHIVCGLRSYYRAMNLSDRIIYLPKIKKDKSLPVVLNYEECKRLFKAPGSLKHRVLLSLIYSSGLRSKELINLKISDIDSHRMLIHIRKTKYRKERYVPLSKCILQGLRKYYKEYRPKEYVFYTRSGRPIDRTTIEGIMRNAVKKAGIIKRATPHTLRHSYATHLIEMGVSVRRLMDLLGHSDIKSTMIYLHLINPAYEKAFSPFDKLYENQL